MARTKKGTKPKQPPDHRPKRHDTSRRQLFTYRRTIVDLLQGFIQGDWVQDLDLSTLKKLPTDYVAKKLNERVGDVVWEVQLRGKPVYIVVILEFQSRQDPFMALRMWTYAGLFLERLIKERGLKKGDKLPTVFPIVFFSGAGKYDVSLEVRDLIEVVPGLEDYQPSMKYLLIDELKHPVEAFANLDNVVGKLLRLQQSDPQQMREIVSRELDWLDEEEPNLMIDLLGWIELAFLPTHQPEAPVPDLRTLDELKTYVEADMETWSDMLRAEGRAKGRTEGRTEGRVEGAASVVLSQIETKFGALSDRLKALVQGADSERLMDWAQRLLTAQRLEEVFGDHAR